MAKAKKYKDLKIEEKTAINFFKAKNLSEFLNEGKVTISEFLNVLLESFFKKFDNSVIKRFKE